MTPSGTYTAMIRVLALFLALAAVGCAASAAPNSLEKPPLSGVGQWWRQPVGSVVCSTQRIGRRGFLRNLCWREQRRIGVLHGLLVTLLPSASRGVA